MEDQPKRRPIAWAAAVALLLSGPSSAAMAQDEIDLMLRHGRVPADRTVSHGYSDFTDPLGRFMDLLAAGAFAEAKSLQPQACADWREARRTSPLTGKFWVWNTQIDLDTLCAPR